MLFLSLAFAASAWLPSSHITVAQLEAAGSRGRALGQVEIGGAKAQLVCFSVYVEGDNKQAIACGAYRADGRRVTGVRATRTTATAIVFDAGDGVSHTVPIYEGVVPQVDSNYGMPAQWRERKPHSRLYTRTVAG